MSIVALSPAPYWWAPNEHGKLSQKVSANGSAGRRCPGVISVGVPKWHAGADVTSGQGQGRS